jgi:hypothetical protein
MRKAAGIVAVVTALAGLSAVPAVAGQSNVVPGSVYKGEYDTGAGMHYKFRVKTFESGTAGNFSLKCAGLERERIEIKKGKFTLKAGADAVLVKGSGKFKKQGELLGEITKIGTNGAECAAGGSFSAVVADQ